MWAQMGQGNGTAPEAAGMGWGRPGAHTGRLGRCKPAAAPQPPHRGLGSEEGLVLQGKERDWPCHFIKGTLRLGELVKAWQAASHRAGTAGPATPAGTWLRAQATCTWAQWVRVRCWGPRAREARGGSWEPPRGLLLPQNSSHGLLALRDLRGLKLSIRSMRK